MAVAGSLTHRTERQGSLRWVFWVLIISFLSGIAIWHWAWDVTVIEYGSPHKTFFDAQIVHPGQKIGLWFSGAKWVRLCKSEIHSRITCQMADPQDSTKTISGRLDLEPHSIDVPKELGPVPLKKRDFIVPNECLPGPLKWSATATSYCSPFGEMNPRTAEPPDLYLTVQ